MNQAEMISPKQMKAIREYALKQLYYYIPRDPDFRLFCHIPNELVSLQYLELYYVSEFNIPHLSKDRIVVCFDGEGNEVTCPNPLPSVVSEIPLNTGGDIDDTSAGRMFGGPWGNDK